MFFVLLAIQEKILKPHTSYSLAKQPAKQIRQFIKQQIDSAVVPPSHTPPSVLVVPGWTHDKDADRGLAASLNVIRDNIEMYDTIVVVGGYFPDQCGQSPPSTPLSAYWGDSVETVLGGFDIDTELRAKIGESTGQKTQSKITDDLIEDSDFFDQPFLWLRGMFPENKKPRAKVLPLLLYATMRDQVQFAATVLNDRLFKPKEKENFGVSADGKRYLVIIPIKVSEGISLFQNCYIENILLDLTFRNKVQDFEQWLYYLTGNTGATFSNTIASQILVVRLSALADKAVPHEKETDPYWTWRMLDYYTTFDDKMDRQKMIMENYRESKETDENTKFSDEIDSPTGHQIYYSMSLSLEPPLHQSVVKKNGKTVVSKMPTLIANPNPFSRGAMQELMQAAQLTMLGRKYTRENFDRYKSELTQAAPYQIRVYVLASHNYEKADQKGAFDKNSDEQQDTTSTCSENILFEVKKQQFYPNKDILTSILEVSQQLYEEKMSSHQLSKFTKDLKKKYAQLVKEGVLPKAALKDDNLDLEKNLVVELQVFHSWEYTNLFGLTEARGQFISLWDGRTAICEVPDSRPESPPYIFFRLTQCCLKNGLDAWDWQRGVVHVFDRTRLTKPVFQIARKDEL